MTRGKLYGDHLPERGPPSRAADIVLGLFGFGMIGVILLGLWATFLA